MTQRNICFTDFTQTQQEYEIMIPDLGWIKYAILQTEVCPETQRDHVQGYLELTKAVRISYLKNNLSNAAHFEPRRGTPEQASEYCCKPDTRKEGCIPFIYGTISRPGKRNDIEDITKMIKENKPFHEIVDEVPSALRFTKGIEMYKQSLNNVRRTWQTEVHVLIGNTGVGKSFFVQNKEGDKLYTVDEPTSTAFFDGYYGQEAVLFDDFKGNIRYTLMLQLLDRYPMDVNIKGGKANWCPKRIYITSNHPIEKWYPNQDVAALKRRITHNYILPDTVTRHEVAGNTIPPMPVTTIDLRPQNYEEQNIPEIII